MTEITNGKKLQKGTRPKQNNGDEKNIPELYPEYDFVLTSECINELITYYMRIILPFAVMLLGLGGLTLFNSWKYDDIIIEIIYTIALIGGLVWIKYKFKQIFTLKETHPSILYIQNFKINTKLWRLYSVYIDENYQWGVMDWHFHQIPSKMPNIVIPAKYDSIQNLISDEAIRSNKIRIYTSDIVQKQSLKEQNVESHNIRNSFYVIMVLIICMGVLIDGFAYYYKYQKKVESETIEIIPATVLPVIQDDIPQTPSSNHKKDSKISEEEQMREPQKTYKECPVCYGITRCGGCGGSGKIYSYGVYTGGEWIDCSACGGSGACGMCQGSGLIEWYEY